MRLFSIRLFAEEVRRLLSRPRGWLAAGGVLALSLANVYRLRDGYLGQASWWEVLKYALSPIEFLLPVLVAGAVGTLMAEDRRSGFASLVLIRSVRPLAYLLSGLAASMVTAAALVAAPLVVAGSLARAIAPPVGIITSFGTVTSRIPAGFPHSSWLSPLVPAVMFAGGAVFIVALATLTGIVTTNLLAVVSVPALLFIVGSTLPNKLSSWAPWTNLEMQSGGPTLTRILVFWTVGALAAQAVSAAVILRRRGL